MNIRDHAIFFWGLVRRWPRHTAIVLGSLAVCYFLYYAGVEALSLVDSLLAGLGMVLMVIFLKTTTLFTFYRLFHQDDFKGSFLILATMAVVPLIAALAISMVVASSEFDGVPLDVAPFLLIAVAVFFSLAIGSTARFFYWIGGGGLKRR